MLLTFSSDKLVDRIISGVKTHTIREDKYSRWRKGMKIHFWRGNPRNVKSNPYQFAEGVVELVLPIHIYPKQNRFILGEQGEFKTIGSLNELAKNDGFDSWEDMLIFFPNHFHGKLIYWMDFKLTKNK